jgi:hypothetical protein
MRGVQEVLRQVAITFIKKVKQYLIPTQERNKYLWDLIDHPNAFRDFLEVAASYKDIYSSIDFHHRNEGVMCW